MPAVIDYIFLTQFLLQTLSWLLIQTEGDLIGLFVLLLVNGGFIISCVLYLISEGIGIRKTASIIGNSIQESKKGDES
ncbi:MAG: hypothetical protein ACFE9L_17560 [Candidatus Hodarchaeota archaeon]